MDKSEAAKALGSRGAQARNRKLSPERRSEIARIAAEKRWGKGNGTDMAKKPKDEAATGLTAKLIILRDMKILPEETVSQLLFDLHEETGEAYKRGLRDSMDWFISEAQVVKDRGELPPDP